LNGEVQYFYFLLLNYFIYRKNDIKDDQNLSITEKKKPLTTWYF